MMLAAGSHGSLGAPPSALRTGPNSIASPSATNSAIVLNGDERARVCTLLARAVLSFQDAFLARESSPSGLLCQVSGVNRERRRCSKLPSFACGKASFEFGSNSPLHFGAQVWMPEPSGPKGEVVLNAKVRALVTFGS
jgi:hypothetical protein